jgi:hypothetical protein
MTSNYVEALTETSLFTGIRANAHRVGYADPLKGWQLSHMLKPSVFYYFI